MKQFLTTILSLWVFLGNAQTQQSQQQGSGINTIWLHDTKVQELANLGMVWGFVKYHHANVRQGKFDMDAELFKVLPAVLASPSKDSTNSILERWVDGFGKPDSCATCKPFVADERTKLAPDYGYLFDEGNLPLSLRNKLNYIKDNPSSGKEHHYLKLSKYAANIEFINEHEYAANSFPDAGIRLLALYRYWNMIQYYYPDRHLIGEDWSRALGKMIPEFCTAADAFSNEMACLKMVARINDTHAIPTAGIDALKKAQGMLVTPFSANFIEEKLIVTGYRTDTLGITAQIKPGDIIETIDGSDVNDLVRRYLPLIPASNFEKKLDLMASSRGLLLRGNDAQAKLTIVRDGERTTITVPRIPYANDMRESDYGHVPDKGYKILEGNIGYIYPAKIKDSDLKEIRALLNETKGIVVDFRCYPTAFMPFTYGKWLKKEPSPFVKFTKGSIDVPGLFEFTEPLENGGGKRKAYKGKIVIIVNSKTQSSAEYQTMALQSIPGAMVVGSKTSGADGNVSAISLPGGFKTHISGIGILYPDGTETQREGVRIDKEVHPTIAGVKAGKDELMDLALKLIND